MASCKECRWWSPDSRTLPSDGGWCMIARTEPDTEGVVRPVVSETPMRAVGDGGQVAASLFTRAGFVCAEYFAR